jgi:hypothetical protein
MRMDGAVKSIPGIEHILAPGRYLIRLQGVQAGELGRLVVLCGV